MTNIFFKTHHHVLIAFAQTKLKFSYRLHAGYVFNAHSKKMPISFLLMINSAKKIKPYILKTSFFFTSERIETI